METFKYTKEEMDKLCPEDRARVRREYYDWLKQQRTEARRVMNCNRHREYRIKTNNKARKVFTMKKKTWWEDRLNGVKPEFITTAYGDIIRRKILEVKDIKLGQAYRLAVLKDLLWQFEMIEKNISRAFKSQEKIGTEKYFERELAKTRLPPNPDNLNLEPSPEGEDGKL